MRRSLGQDGDDEGCDRKPDSPEVEQRHDFAVRKEQRSRGDEAGNIAKMQREALVEIEAVVAQKEPVDVVQDLERHHRDAHA